MAKATYLLQGLNAEMNHKKSIQKILEINDLKKAIFSVAFLRSEGVEFLSEQLEKVADKVNFFVGVRNGITSKQGLEQLLSIGVQPYVVDTGTQHYIFHPKIYIVHNNNKAFSLIGSANFTNGGLISNIESSCMLELNMYNKDDEDYINSICEAFDELKNNYPENIYKLRSYKEVEELFNQGLVIDEERNTTYKNISTNTSNNKAVTPRMKLNIEKVKRKAKIKSGGSENEQEKEIVSINSTNLVGKVKFEVWESKELTERDLNIPTGNNTNVTGSMTLKKGRYYDIDQRHYFREEVFKDLKWEKTNTKRPHLEYADVDMFIIIEGINYGKYRLKLKHDTRTNTKSYKQNNAMTHLLWKESKTVIRNENLLGKHLKLSKIQSENIFIIEIN